MQDKENCEHYVIEIVCDNVHILLPVEDVKKIVSRKDIQQTSKPATVRYQEKDFFACSFSRLLKRHSYCQEDYAILIQHEDIEAIIYVEKIVDIKRIDEFDHEFPKCFKEWGIDYLVSYHNLEGGKLAFQIDFIKLLKESYNVREEIYE